MFETDPSEKSLVSILQDRYDTCFDGYEIAESDFIEYQEYERIRTYKDEFGGYYSHPHDYIQTREREDRAVGILVADENDMNCGVGHPHPDVPHLMGLYVREPYRSTGIASDLVHDCLAEMGSDRCIVDCSDDVKPFYEQLDCRVIYLRQFKSL